MLPIILLADDDNDDADLFCEAVKQTNPAIDCHCVSNGHEVFTQLSERSGWRPDVIMLDINMPVMNGWDCLAVLKKDHHLANIPVIMYSTSSHPDDVNRAVDSGALCFFTKPDSYNKLKDIVGVIIHAVATNKLQEVCARIEAVA